MKMLIGYLLGIAISVLVAKFLDGTLGVLMLAFLLLVPLFSFALTFLVRKKIFVSMQSVEFVKKGADFPVRVQVTKQTILPMPYLTFQIAQDLHFATLPLLPTQISLLAQRQYTTAQTMTAAICGSAVLQLPNSVLSDYLGFLHLKLRQPQTVRLLVLPDIPELMPGDALFHAFSSAVRTEQEETEESVIQSFGANVVAGYDHRPYVAGDSPKRINWKLSSKKDVLMVRLDESVSLAKTRIILDLTRAVGVVETVELLQAEERLIEGALGMMSLCIRQGIACSFEYNGSAGWKKCTIESEEAIAAEVVALLSAGIPTASKQDRMPADANASQSANFLVYTALPDASLLQTLSALAGSVHLIIPCEQQGISAPSQIKCWLLKEDFCMQAN